MRLRCSLWPRWLCPFRRPARPATIVSPQAARHDFNAARARLTGAALDGVDTAEFAAKGAIAARDRVRAVGVRAERSAEETPIMRAANEAARQVSDITDGRDGA